MENKYNNIEELRDIAPAVANLGNQNLYSVPNNYFDSLADSIINLIRLTEIHSINPYSIPDGYFDILADSIMHKVQLNSSNEIDQELLELAPLLNTVNKANAFSIPDGYFERLSISGIKTTPAKVISVGRSIQKWVTYAAAASVLFIVAATTYLYVTVHGHLSEKNLTIEQRLGQLNDQEIISYLKENEEIISGDVIPASVEQDTELQRMLQNASDEDIQKYLNEYSDPTEKPVEGI
jgi:hypothetical protein